MLFNSKWLNLQLFAGEGSTGGEGGEGAAATGETTAAIPGQQSEEDRLSALGVPKEVLEKRAQRRSKHPNTVTAARSAAMQDKTQNAAQQVAAAETQTEETAADTGEETSTAPKMTWDEVLKNEEFNKEIQKIVQARLRTSKVAEENLQKLAPALEVLARQHGQDVENLDYEALANAISNDNQFYEDKAFELGITVEEAKQKDQQERSNARQQRQEEQTLEQQRFQKHIEGLQQQGEAMKAVFPNFNLMEELKNPVFQRMTAPNVGISVADAYYAVHRNEIQFASMQAATQQAMQQAANAVQAGQHRPAENGTSAQAPSVTTFNYRNASREQRDALKKRIYEAQARGEKIYPGQW